MPFTDFGSLAIIGLVMGLITLRTIYQIYQNRTSLFDDTFTMRDRQLMGTAAFFVLVPISVFFHEVGHAVAVWYFDGEVLQFGYFLFFGFVAHQGFYTAQDLFWIAAWGNIVSIVMGLGALAWAFLRPMRAALNYLLIMFGVVSILISLVFYPLMDLLSDLHGDWSQIYTWDTPALSIATGILHGGILLGLIALWQVDRIRMHYARITQLRPEEVRKLRKPQAERELRQAAEAAAEEFHGLARVEPGPKHRDAVSVSIQWTSGGYHRAAIVLGVMTGQRRVEVYGTVRALDGSNMMGEQRIGRVRGIPEPQKLTPQIVKCLQVIDRFELQSAQDVASGSTEDRPAT